MLTRKPVWEECPDCGEYWCNLHQEHVHECMCPPVDDWLEEFDELPYDLYIPVVILDEYYGDD